jgi:hypothetical protein
MKFETVLNAMLKAASRAEGRNHSTHETYFRKYYYFRQRLIDQHYKLLADLAQASDNVKEQRRYKYLYNDLLSDVVGE